MDVRATLHLRNLPSDYAECVGTTLRETVCEWLDFDRHPQDLTVTLWPQLVECLRRPVFVVSDLHLGDGGPRDNSAVAGKMDQFSAFLDYVESSCGGLVIVGDLFEFWQANVSKVIVRHLGLLNRLAAMQAVYVLGNHDADLLHFCHTGLLEHPIFHQMVPDYEETIGGKRFKFIHGHQADPYCASDTPGKGRISAIYSGIWEDRNGSPWMNKYHTVEEALVGRVERLIGAFQRLFVGDRARAMNRRLLDLCPNRTVVCGHTHKAGSAPRLYNAGTWAERVNSFVRIEANGGIRVYDWIDSTPVLNLAELPT